MKPEKILLRGLRLFLLRFLFCAALLNTFSASAADPFADLIRKTNPLTPADEQKSFHLPPGFEIQLVASEPDIGKPINLAFDAKGRLWLTQSREYPHPVLPVDKNGRDKIMILERFASSGRAKKITTFAEGLNIPLGLYPFKNGVIAFSIPKIHFFQDTNGDGKADKDEILLTGFGYEKDTHGLTSNFRRGYDGWIYADHGFNNDSKIGARDGSAIEMNSGNCYRFKPDGSRVEQYSWGQVNPFGLMFDALGDLWSADCHSSPVYQLLRGAYYPSFGKPHDGLGFAPNICEHSHGSTAIAGIVFYAATNFPPQFRNTTFVGNVMSSRINRDSYIEHGSTRLAKEEQDFLTSDDPWFRPVDLQLGPDGAIYVADFYNRIIGHYEVPLDHPGRDRERGRIWRIVYVGGTSYTSPTSKSGTRITRPSGNALMLPASLKKLIAELGDPNITRRMLAMNEIIDRIGKPAIEPVQKMMRDKRSTAFQKVHGLWILHRLGALDEKFLPSAAEDSDPGVRVHAMRVLSETKNWTSMEHASALSGLMDESAHVQRAAADALGLHSQTQNVKALLHILREVKSENDRDSQLIHTLRMALRNQLSPDGNFREFMTSEYADVDSAGVADIAPGIKTAEAGKFLLAHVQKFSEDRDKLPNYLKHAARFAPESQLGGMANFSRSKFADDLDFQLTLFKSVQDGLAQRGEKSNDVVHGWGVELTGNLLSSAPGSITNRADKRRESAAELVASLKLVNFEPQLAALLADQNASEQSRAAAAKALQTLAPDKHVADFEKIFADADEPMKLREKIAALLGEINSPETRTLLIEKLSFAPNGLQMQIALALAASTNGVEALLENAESGKISPRILQERVVKDRLLGLKSTNVTGRVESLTKNLPPISAERQKLIDERVAAFVSAEASATRGAEVFKQNCAVCHSIDGQGGLVGPQLDGIGARGAARLAEDILDSSRNVDPAFRYSIVTRTDDEVVTGLQRREEGEVMVFVDATGKEISVPKKEIKERRQSELSLMPDNFSEAIKPEDFNDLLAFLLSKNAK